jgi:hypothetical protein
VCGQWIIRSVMTLSIPHQWSLLWGATRATACWSCGLTRLYDLTAQLAFLSLPAQMAKFASRLKVLRFTRSRAAVSSRLKEELVARATVMFLIHCGASRGRTKPIFMMLGGARLLSKSRWPSFRQPRKSEMWSCNIKLLPPDTLRFPWNPEVCR